MIQLIAAIISIIAAIFGFILGLIQWGYEADLE